MANTRYAILENYNCILSARFNKKIIMLFFACKVRLYLIYFLIHRCIQMTTGSSQMTTVVLENFIQYNLLRALVEDRRLR